MDHHIVLGISSNRIYKMSYNPISGYQGRKLYYQIGVSPEIGKKLNSCTHPELIYGRARYNGHSITDSVNINVSVKKEIPPQQGTGCGPIKKKIPHIEAILK